MAADEGAAKVDVLQVVLLGVQVGDLADVVAVGRSLVRVFFCSFFLSFSLMVWFEGCKDRKEGKYIPDGKEQTPADVLGFKRPPVYDPMATDSVSIAFVPSAQIFGLLLRSPLHLVHFAEAAGDGGGFQADLAVIRAVDVADQHVDRRVVSVFGELQHLVEVAGTREQGEQTPESAAAQRGAAHSLVLARTGDFHHGHAAADVDEEVRVDVWTGGDEVHGVCFAVGEDFLGDFVDEEVEAWRGSISLITVKQP